MDPVCRLAQTHAPGALAWACDAERMQWVLLGGLLALVVALGAGVGARRGAVPESKVEAPVRRRRGAPRVLLLGTEQTGKTALVMRSALGAVPETATSQKENVAKAQVGELRREVQLIDVPGHKRLRGGAEQHMDEVDAVVYCVDASVASRGGSGTTAATALSTLKQTDLQDALTESVDYLHEVLGMLARRRRDAGDARGAPALLVLFTRADRSPLFSDRALLQDERRRAQLLTRCRVSLDTALTSLRASRGLQRAGRKEGRVTVEGISAVDAAPASSSVWRAVRWLVPPFLRRAQEEAPLAAADAAHPTRFGHNVRSGEGHQVSDELAMDYVDAEAVRGPDSHDVLARLHKHVVSGGSAAWGLASVQPGGWRAADPAGESLEDLHAWLVGL